MRLQDRYYNRYGPTHPAHNVVRIAGSEIEKQASRYFSGKLLEIGCGAKEKSWLVSGFVEKHIGLDLPSTLHDTSNIDIYATAYRIPAPSHSFDCVLSTAVLEHLEEPQKALAEAYRVLKPGGYALYTAPLFWHLHEEPRDFYRYTKYGLQYLFCNVGFEIVEIKALSGFWVTFGTAWSYYLHRFNRGPFRHAVSMLVVINNWLFSKLDRALPRATTFTWMYLVVARKPL